jgi:transposase
MRGVPFDVKVYMKAVESYLVGKRSAEEIARKAGISQTAFFRKLREYKAKGKIEEPQTHPIKGPKALKRTKAFNRALARLKRRHPDYGRTRLGRELAKKGFEVSKNTITRALAELGLSLPPKKGGSARLSSTTARRRLRK